MHVCTAAGLFVCAFNFIHKKILIGMLDNWISTALVRTLCEMLSSHDIVIYLAAVGSLYSVKSSYHCISFINCVALSQGMSTLFASTYDRLLFHMIYNFEILTSSFILVCSYVSIFIFISFWKKTFSNFNAANFWFPSILYTCQSARIAR